MAVTHGTYRYATAARFAPPTPVRELDAVPRAICPQPSSRLDHVMGSARDSPPIPQSEDCLQLTVFAPRDPPAPLPVVVFFHGGGFFTGGGSWGWYDGSRLAAHGVIVVTANYRLAAFGYLCLPNRGLRGDLGLQDQLAALKWVQANISTLGGDPTRVTVVGQSAGALSIAAMFRSSSAKGLFHRALLLSPPLRSLADRMPNDAAQYAAQFLSFLGQDPDTAPAAAILRAQAKLAQWGSVRSGGDPLKLPFFPAVPRWSDPVALSGVPTIIGWNVDDLGAWWGEPSRVERDTADEYGGTSSEFAAELEAAGNPCARFRWDERPPGSRLGGVHCLELPFLFGTQEAWRDCPMLGTYKWDEVERRGHPMRAALAQFASDGDVESMGRAGLDKLVWRP